jgi:hypothetical protein
VAQGETQTAQVSDELSAWVPEGQLAAVTHEKLVKKLVEHEVHRVSLVQLKHGSLQGAQILELFP